MYNFFTQILPLRRMMGKFHKAPRQQIQIFHNSTFSHYKVPFETRSLVNNENAFY